MIATQWRTPMSLDFKRASISCVILLVLSAQAYRGLTSHGPAAWPIISYPMYAWAKAEGQRMQDYTLTAVFYNGREIPNFEEQLGVPFWLLRENVTMPIVNGRFNSEESKQSLRVLCEKSDQMIVRLDVFDIGVSVGRGGIVYGEPMKAGSVDIDCYL
jgi:hypothetical protein